MMMIMVYCSLHVCILFLPLSFLGLGSLSHVFCEIFHLLWSCFWRLGCVWTVHGNQVCYTRASFHPFVECYRCFQGLVAMLCHYIHFALIWVPWLGGWGAFKFYMIERYVCISCVPVFQFCIGTGCGLVGFFSVFISYPELSE